MAHKCHGKNKISTSKPKTSRQKQKPFGKTKKLTAKTKYLMHDKTKNLTAKPKTSRQNQILHSKNQIPHGKSKYPRQNQSYFAFAVKYLVLPWGFWFGFALRFSVLPWHLWAIIGYQRWLWRNGTRISVGIFRREKQDYLFRCSIVLVVPEILSWNDRPNTGHVPFTFQPDFPESFCNW